jgi:hypothetical protein
VKFIDGIQAERDAAEKDDAGLIPRSVIWGPSSRFTRITREHPLDLPRPAG